MKQIIMNIIVAIFLILAFFLFSKIETKAAYYGEDEWLEYIEYCCEKNGISGQENIIAGICFVESSWTPEISNKAGTHHGLMQISPKSNASYMTEDTDLHNAYDAIYVGVEIYADLYEKTGDVVSALNRYNGNGCGKKESSYSRKVLKYASEMEK